VLTVWNCDRTTASPFRHNGVWHCQRES
jgi:hypothetical protein